MKGQQVLQIIKDGKSHLQWNNKQLGAMCSWYKPKTKGFEAIPTIKSQLIQYWEKILGSNEVICLDINYVQSEIEKLEKEISEISDVEDDIIDDEDDIDACQPDDSSI